MMSSSKPRSFMKTVSKKNITSLLLELGTSLALTGFSIAVLVGVKTFKLLFLNTKKKEG